MVQRKHWWDGYPWRMIQTNLREIDMEDMDAEKYAQDLQDFGVTVVTLNAAGIIASYDTRLDFHTKSDYLHGDSLQSVIDACHKRGIRVIARTDFSKIRYPLYEKHPEWAYRDRDGCIVNYNGDVQTCPNGGYQGEAMFTILREVLSTHTFDGLFCNMAGFLVMDYSGVYHGPCHCESCRKKFREAYGLDIPEKDDPRDPVYMKYAAFRNACTAAHRKRLIETVRAIDPDLAINGVDYMRTESNTEIGVASWPFSASSNARLSAGALRTRPADNASVDFIGFRYRDTSVSPALTAMRLWQSLANAGSLSFFIMGRLDNHRDVSGFGLAREVFEFHKAHESLFTGMVSAAEVLLVHRPMMARVDTAVGGWVKALTFCHVPFDEIRLNELSAEVLQGKRLVILPGCPIMKPELAALLDSFVEKGGQLIASGETGFTQDRQVLKSLGVTALKERRKGCMSSVFLVQERDAALFPSCAEAPYIPFGSDLTVCEYGDGAEKYFSLIPEHPFGPPERCYYTEITDIPGIVAHPYGKGKAVHIPWNIGAFYFSEGWQNTLNVFRDVLFRLCGLPEIAPDLPPMAELVLCRHEGKPVIQLVNESGCFSNNYFRPVPLRQICLKLPGLTGREKPVALRGGKAELFEENGLCAIMLDELKDYEAIILE